MAIIDNEVKINEFDLFTTMLLIQENKRIGVIFTNEYGDDFKKYFLLIKQNMFGDEATNYVESIFNDIIKADDNYIEEYNNLITKPKNKVERYKNVKRRIPMSELKKQIESRGKMTENERAMLAGNELKNIVARIHNKGKQSLFTDEDARNVIATIDIVKRKLLPILNKK
jgi:hypothetical protein